MKLTKRIVLLTAMILVAAMTLGCITTFAFARIHVLQSVQAAALTDYTVFRAAYATTLIDMPKELPDNAARSLRRMRFHKTAGSEEYALLRDDRSEIVANNTGIDPLAALTEEKSRECNEDGIRSRYLAMDDRYLLVIGTRVLLGGDYYMLALVRDVTKIMSGLSSLLVRTAAACTLLTMIAVCLSVLLLNCSLRPIGALRRGTERFRDGNYAHRIEVRGKDELAALAEQFNAMAAAIEQHIRMVEATSEERRLLLSALSHEMKTPVTAITGYAHALTRARLSEAQREEAIRFIDSECRRLERLSGKLMQLISLRGADLSHETTDAADFAAALRPILQPIAAEEGLSLTITADTASLCIERDLMTAAVTNLFDNAKKAGAAHIGIAIERNGIRVTDDGRGIPAAEIAHITKPFYVLDKSRNAAGFGLGLALVQRIAELHSSTLHIESTEGLGTRITIPLTAQPPQNDIKRKDAAT